MMMMMMMMHTGCTADTNTQHLHEETNILPVDTHLKLHASQLRQKACNITHPLHSLPQQKPPPRHHKTTIFQPDNEYIKRTDKDILNEENIKLNIKTIHKNTAQQYPNNKTDNKIINQQAPKINSSEESLPRPTRRL